MTILVDTSVLINVLRDREAGNEVLAKMARSGNVLVISAMTVGEVYAGMRQAEKRRSEKLLSSFECYAITEAIAKRAGELRNGWRRKGRTLELADMMIAATALEYGFALATENRKDFPMPELVFQPLS